MIGALRGHQSLAREQWHNAFAHVIGLFEVRIARQNEFIDAEGVVLHHPLRDLGIAADQCRARATANQPGSRAVVIPADVPCPGTAM